MLTLASGVTLSSNTPLKLQGGALIDNNGVSESFATVSLALGGSGLTVGNSSTLTLPSATRATGETLAFTIGSGSSITSANGTTAGILGGWAVLNGSNWAAVNGGGGIIPYGTSPAGSYTTLTTSGGGTQGTTNFRLNSSLSSSAITANSLNITDTSTNTSPVDTLALGANNATFNTASGGLLYSAVARSTSPAPATSAAERPANSSSPSAPAR